MSAGFYFILSHPVELSDCFYLQPCHESLRSVCTNHLPVPHVNCRQPHFSGCWSADVERPAGGQRLIDCLISSAEEVT